MFSLQDITSIAVDVLTILESVVDPLVQLKVTGAVPIALALKLKTTKSPLTGLSPNVKSEGQVKPNFPT